MRITCLQERLKRALALVGRVVPPRPHNPILAGVRLSAEGGQLTLAATNLEVGVTCRIEAEMDRDEDGSIVVPARLFADIVGGLPNDRVTLILDARAQTLRVECGRFVNNLKGADADDFPPIPALADGETTASLPADALRQAIAQTAFAAAADVSRPVLTGVLTRLRERTLFLAAADGFRLAACQVPLAEPVSAAVEFIAPARALVEVARAVKDAEGAEGAVDLIVSPSENQALFHTPYVDVACGLIDGRYPDIERVIPREVDGFATVSVSDLAAALRLARCFTSPLHPGVALRVENATLHIASRSPEHGDHAGEVACVQAEGQWEIALKAEYLADALNALNAQRVALQWMGANKPLLLVAEDENRSAGADGVHVIMPLSRI